MNDPDPTTPATVAANKPLRDVLLEFWTRAGRPTAEKMAEFTNLPPGLFTSFLASDDFPGLDETGAMVRAVAPLAWHGVLIRRWHEANAQRHATRPVPLPRRSGTSDTTTAIGAAIAATTFLEFAAALDRLKEERGLTYEQIAKNSGYVVSKSAAHRFASSGRSDRQEFVDAFLRACGVDELNRGLWLTAWRTVNQNTQAQIEQQPAARTAEPTATAAGPSTPEPSTATPVEAATRLRLVGVLAATSLAGSAAATIRLCSSPAARRWLLLAGLSAAGAAILILLAEIHHHLATTSRCATPESTDSSSS
jgi:transcriptional regulator with XRE-family HTH domain